MNKDNAHLYLPLVQALADGKTIQYKSPYNDKWEDKTSVQFDSSPDQYRIKPEPIKQEFYYVRSNNTANLPTEYAVYGYQNYQAAKEHLKKIDPKGKNFVLMHVKAEQIE